MKKEIVFEVWGKDGGIRILRDFNQETNRDAFFLAEFDAERSVFDESIIRREYDNFEVPFSIIHKKFTWFFLNLLMVNEDYRDYVLTHLIEKLNKFNTAPEQLKDTREDLEKALNIKLVHDFLPIKNGVQEITITNLVKMREYEYIDEKLKGTYEIAFNPSTLDNVEETKSITVRGVLEAKGGAIYVKDISDQIRYAFSAESFFIQATPLKSRTKGWFYEY